jgi:hypothetical protein
VCVLAGSPAQAASKDSGIVDASKRVAGVTAGQLLGEEWRQLLELSPDANPYLGKGDNCLSAGHRDKVLIVWTTLAPKPPAACNVKPGTPVFFYALGGECSSVEAPPYFGATEEEQRRCIVDSLRATPFDAILVSIDGGPPVNIGVESFLAVSGQGTVDLPDPNILGVPGNPQATFVAAAYAALLRPLPPGNHTIAVTIVGGAFAGPPTRAVVNVVPGLKRSRRARSGPPGRRVADGRPALGWRDSRWFG